MAGANVNLGVSGLAAFKRNINDAKATVNAFDEALKLNEKQADTSSLYLENKIALMKQQIEAQTEVVKQTQAALEQMVNEGKSKTGKAYQDMLAKQYGETGKLQDMQKALKDLETGATGAATGLDSVGTSVENIGQNVSWETVANGLGKITDTLERGAKAALNFGKRIINSLKGSSGWADDLQTMADSFDIPLDQLQRMEKVSYIVETDAEAILRARDRMSKAVAGEGREDIAELLGINVTGNEDPEDLMWDIGDALLHMENAYDKEAAAQKIFGRSWRELVPLFKTGREEYEKMLAEQSVLTDEQIKNLTEADDAIAKMELEIQTLKNEFWSENADKITALLQWLIDNKDSVVTALEVIGGGFAALKLAEFAANLGQTISGFKTLGLLGGKKAAEALAPSAVGTGVQGWLSRAKENILPEMLGFGGLATIVAGFSWAADRRLNHRDQVRGTDEYLTAQSAGAEALLADYIRAQQVYSQMDMTTAAEVFEAAAIKVSETYDKLMEAEGGANALQAYSDWRQERNLGNMDWEMPEELARMTSVAEQTSANEIQSNSEVVATLSSLQGLPAQVAAAVQAGMSSVTIVISEGAVGEIGRRGGRSMWNNVVSALN